MFSIEVSHVRSGQCCITLRLQVESAIQSRIMPRNGDSIVEVNGARGSSQATAESEFSMLHTCL